ncbi:MBL fold metallo-hydrolase [Euzebyella marina]|uniref:MBL fold metallo-hydrolase n=1 Tax=Euzebyella marina TaxID=1761453 RepID=A0A3G2L2B1_9FLAO|nr:MBL fold metallo-hydrolase [Euzebyella marina]AYN66361.1 MBL fold metallo-hydrolase [Euzebyella marina]
MKKLVFLLVLVSGILEAQVYNTVKVNDDLYMVGDRTFSVFYVTDSSVVVIDPINKNHAEATQKAIREITDLPISHVFYSHNHWDHISGAAIFKSAGTKIISHEMAAKNITPNSVVLKPDETWTGMKNEIIIGNKELELYFYGRNHGDGMTVFRFAEENIVFTIDLVVPDRVLYAYLPDADPQNWVSSLEKIDELEFDKLLMSHVRAIGTRKDLHLVQEYFKDLYEAVQLELDKGTAFFEIPETVKLPKYKEWKNYDEWLPMNVWRILMEKSIGK